jgi:CRP-like cAMP-binding protein
LRIPNVAQAVIEPVKLHGYLLSRTHPVGRLTDSARTATVVAEIDTTVWRLSRARFEALLGQERSIAQSIERSLSLRLAATTQEAGARSWRRSSPAR